MIEETEIEAHKADQPYVVGDLFDAEVLSGEDVTDVDLLYPHAHSGQSVAGVAQCLEPSVKKTMEQLHPT